MDTLHRHESILRAVAKRGKYLVHEDCIYREVVSGENIFSRPQMIRLLEDVTKGKYQSVLGGRYRPSGPRRYAGTRA